MYIDECFDFGKFRGVTVRQVYQGNKNINRDLIKSYLKKRLEGADIHFNDCAVLLDMMNFEISDTLMRVTPVLDDFKGDWTKTIEGFFKDVYEPSADWALNFLDSISLDDYNRKYFSIGRDTPELTSGNPTYIEWCIKTIDGFYIEPDELDKLLNLDICRFVGIEVLHKIDDIYEYKQKSIFKKHSFSYEIVQLNEEKYNAANNRRYINYDDDDDDYDEWDNSEDDYCGGCESSPCRCSDPDPG